MVGTVRAARRSAGTALALGLVAGSVATLLLAALVGSSLRPGLLAVAGVCAAAAAIDLLGLRVRPQNPFQVPEPWRRTMPLPVAALLYGLLLGTGAAGSVSAAATWGLLLVVLALGKATVAVAAGIALGLGRALPILALPSADSIADRTRPLRALRAVAAVALVGALLAASAHATVVATATDPSAVDGELAWQQPGVGGFLRTAAETKQLPGSHPAIGGSLVAWRVGDSVTVAERGTLTPLFEEQIVGVRELAISDSWLVMRTVDARGGSRLIAQSIANTNVHTIVAGVRSPSAVGRPDLDGTVVVFATATPEGSWISAVDLSTGKARRLRRSSSAQLLNPSLHGGELLYVESSRCSQQLRLEPLDHRGGRALLTERPLAGADPGFQRGYVQQGKRTPCRTRPKPTTTMLWTTALSPTAAYVTTLRPRGGGATTTALVELAR